MGGYIKKNNDTKNSDKLNGLGLVHMGFISYVCIVRMREMKNKRRTKEEGHMAQLIRRKMIQKSKPSAKVYKRKNGNKLNEKGLV
jgi:hypothetical protein